MPTTGSSRGRRSKSKTVQTSEVNEGLAEQKKQRINLSLKTGKPGHNSHKNKKDQQGLIAEVSGKKKASLPAQLRKSSRRLTLLTRPLKRIIADAIAANNKGSGSTSREVFELTPEAKELAANFASNKGKLPWPVKSGRCLNALWNPASPGSEIDYYQ